MHLSRVFRLILYLDILTAIRVLFQQKSLGIALRSSKFTVFVETHDQDADSVWLIGDLRNVPTTRRVYSLSHDKRLRNQPS